MKTTAIPTPIEAKLRSPTLDSQSSGGLLNRIAVLVVWQGVTFGLILTVDFLVAGSRDPLAMILAFSIMQVAPVSGMIFTEHPRGNDWMPARLYLSTGIRSGVPLFAALVLDYFLYPDFLRHGLLTLLILYVVGLLFSILISVRRLDANPR